MTAKFAKAPHISIIKYPNPPAAPASKVPDISVCRSTNGTGTKIRSLYNANIAIVNQIFFITFLLLMISFAFLINFFIAVGNDNIKANKTRCSRLYGI